MGTTADEPREAPDTDEEPSDPAEQTPAPGESAEELRAWVQDQVAQFAPRQPLYERYAATLDEILRGVARDLAPLAMVQTRPKTITSFAEKILRKRDEDPDPVNQFTDLCGGRVIGRTRAEIDAVTRYVEDHFEIDWENSDDTSKRLEPTEFGYRSVHYIVSLRPDVDYGVDVETDLLGLKAEIQLRTIVEHAWSDFAHDLTYKGSFPLPLAWQRELAGVAATLEEVDGVFARIQEGLAEYATSFGAYLTEEEMRGEAARLGIVLEHDPGNVSLAVRRARLAITLGEWEQAVEVLSPFLADEVAETPQPVLLDLGVALCRQHDNNRRSEGFVRGRRYLELAAAPEHGDVEAFCSYAGTWAGEDDNRARELYRQAFELDPADPEALGGYLELALPRDAALLESVRPLLRRAIERGRRHVAAGINLPWAHYHQGRFHLLLDEPFESLDAYARAIRTSPSAFMVETALDSLERLGEVIGDRPGHEWARRLLTLGLACRFPTPEATARVGPVVTADLPPVSSPVVIVAGGTDPRVEEQMRGYAELLQRAFVDFRGTVVSGGTEEGISGIVAELGQASAGRVHTVGYLPGLTPNDATRDARYDELRETPGHGFSPLEPLQNWIDLISAGVDAAEVRVLGVNGGRIAAIEYRVALALGASVGLLADSGREAGRLFADEDWASAPGLVRLPVDAETLAAFITTTPTPLPDDTRDTVGRAVHRSYVQERREQRAAEQDAALADWEDLPADLKDSNRQQADHIARKLERVGCTLAPAGEDEPAQFTDEEVERLAEVEHGRWNAERLLAGWRWGPDRDPDARTSPYLVSWTDLPEEIRDYDREAVRNIPALLAAVGLSIRRVDEPDDDGPEAG